MGFIVVIPAREASTRLPGKPLLDIGGLPMVIHTAGQAAKSAAKQVIIATDSQAIADTVTRHGFDAVMTSTDHATGTDRLAEAADKLGLNDQQIVVNVQGDEPFIDPEIINAVARLLQQRTDAMITTCAARITDAATLFNPNNVKVVCDSNQRALYFSRAPIPWARDVLATTPNTLAPELPAWLHLGLYAYRCQFLRIFHQLPAGQLEAFESLEQLRALEQGMPIYVHYSQKPPHKGIDTPEDLAIARARFDLN